MSEGGVGRNGVGVGVECLDFWQERAFIVRCFMEIRGNFVRLTQNIDEIRQTSA